MAFEMLRSSGLLPVPRRRRRGRSVSVIVVVPASPDKIHRNTASTVLTAVSAPIAAMFCGNCQVDRGSCNGSAESNDWILIPKLRCDALNREHTIVTGRTDANIDIEMNARVRNTGKS